MLKSLIACLFLCATFTPAVANDNSLNAIERRIAKLSYEKAVAFDAQGNVLFVATGNCWQIAIPGDLWYGKRIDVLTHNYPIGCQNWEDVYFGDYPAAVQLGVREFRIVHAWPNFVMHHIVRIGPTWPNLSLRSFYKQWQGSVRKTWTYMAAKYKFIYQ